ncbi:MAG: GWxTD domain-containing protein [Gemmatimonadales bacterium]
MKSWPVSAGLVFVLASCAKPRAEQPIVAATSSVETQAALDPTVVYHRMGLIATGTPLSFVGKIAYFATSSPDSTMMLASVSIPNRSLSFIREGDSYRAPYEVHVVLTQGTTPVDAVNSMEIVRVPTFKEVNRTDESVIFQHYFKARPGNYNISFQVRDATSSRNATQEGLITIPSLRNGRLSTPILVYEAAPRTTLDSVPRILASPRSSAVFGQDSSVAVYLEGYGTEPRLAVQFVVQNDRGAITLRDTVVLQRHGSLLSGSVNIPISRVGIGIANVTFTRGDATDTVRTPVFVSFGDDIPLLTYEEMLLQLRYFAAPDRIKTLRDASPEKRGTAWAEFLRSTDPVPGTSENEGLQSYFVRVVQANSRFREEAGGRTGWLSDRGKVYVALGEPDQIYEQTTNAPLSNSSIANRGRLQYWEYTQYRVRFLFYDETGTGRWRITPGSEADFQSINARLLAR